MLAMADEHGKVEASTSGLARFANVTIGQCREALKALSEPDSDSRTENNEGRRVRKVEGGWLILNYLKYREMRSPKQVAEAERKAKWRDKRDTSPMSPVIRAAVAVDVDEAVKEKALPTEPRTANSNGRAAIILAQIRALAEESQNPAQPATRFIRREKVLAMGENVLLAYEAIGGAERVLSATGKDHSFLARDFAAALEAANTPS